MAELIANLVSALRRDEGERLTVYQDTLGVWTLGVGRNVDGAHGGGITKVESAYLLQNDITTKTAELEKRAPWIWQMSEPRIGVFLNMAFQLGVEGLMKFNQTLRLAEQGEYFECSRQMLKSLWAQQTPERALRMSKQMAKGEWQ